MTLDELKRKLEVITSLKENETISTFEFLPINKSTWAGSFWRTIARDNAKATYDAIYSVYLEACEIEELAERVKTSFNGLRVLMKTYSDNKNMVGDLDTLIYIFTETPREIQNDEIIEIEQKDEIPRSCGDKFLFPTTTAIEFAHVNVFKVL